MMKLRWKSLRTLGVAAVFVAATGFGAVQAFAGSMQANRGACDQWQCRAECGALGGHLYQNTCYCCG